jgi:hypothetical protein
MLWRCPACQSPINHSPIEPQPRAGVRYRCHVCRLELELDQAANRLDVAPFDGADDEARRRQARTKNRTLQSGDIIARRMDDRVYRLSRYMGGADYPLVREVALKLNQAEARVRALAEGHQSKGWIEELDGTLRMVEDDPP